MSKRERKFKIEIYEETEDRGCSSVGTVDVYNMPTKEDIVRLLLNVDHAWVEPDDSENYVRDWSAWYDELK